ncbi:MAG TPA: hypothetical protein VN207_05680, partial [Ktedonobacteraceae bacterium]|nr:hypothetical protein [Ktedonobacteraceae bacterium]
LHLPLQRAISVLPLTADQIDRYLSSAQGQLEGLRQALHDDTELSELARRPLMLSIFTLAYQGRAVDDFPVRGSLEEQRQQVFATYVQRMFERRGVNTRYTQKQAKWWLSWLAQQMVRHNQVEFYIEQLQIDWFSGSQRSKLFGLVLCWLVTWVTLGSIDGLIIALITRQLAGFLAVLAIELIVVSFYSYYDYSELEGKIETTEVLSWYPQEFWRSAWNSIISTFKEEPGSYLAGGVLGAIVGLFCGVATGLLYGLPKGLINGLITGLVSGVLLMLLMGVANDMPAKQLDKNIKPNQGIWRSAYISLSVALGFILFFGLPSGLFSGLSQGLPIGLVSGVICGFLFGTFLGLVAGGYACIKHVYLRFLLWCARSIPWDYVQFLDYATERLLLRKVGGGYIFIHRLLLDYFAALDEPASMISTSKKVGID